MQCSQDELIKKIAREEFSNCYVFYGEETFLIKSLTKKIVSFAVCENFLQFNFKSCYFEDFSKEEMMDFFNMPAMFSKKKVFVLKCLDIANFLKKDIDFFINFAKNLSGDDILILTFSDGVNDVKKNNGFKKIFSSLKEAVFVEFGLKSESWLVRFFLNRLKKSGFLISEKDLIFLIRRCGNDIETLNNELKKLCYFVADSKEIKKQDILVLTKPQIKVNVFNIVKNLLDGKKKEALMIFNELIFSGENIFLIFSAICVCFIDLYRAKCAVLNSVSFNDLCKYFNYKGKEFRIKNAYLNCKKYPIEKLRRCVILTYELDVKLKTQNLPKEILMHQFLFFVC